VAAPERGKVGNIIKNDKLKERKKKKRKERKKKKRMRGTLLSCEKESTSQAA
jgi:hypothetical protein